MNSLVIPPCPNWYEYSIFACTPDNILIYGARNDIVIIKTTSDNLPNNVKIISGAHSLRISCVTINYNWTKSKLCLTVGQEQLIKIWNGDTWEREHLIDDHLKIDKNDKIVGAGFAGDDRVISVSESGLINNYRLTTRSSVQLKNVLGSKVIVTCMSICPHATFLAAFGLKNGLVVVVHLKRTGKVLYKLRGHDKSVVSLSWCPAPVNVFPRVPGNEVVNKSIENPIVNLDNNDKSLTDEKTSEIESVETEKESNKENVEIQTLDNKSVKTNPWINLKHADDDEIQSTECEEKDNNESSEQDFDFLSECAKLKQKIMNVEENNDLTSTETGKDEQNVEIQSESIKIDENATKSEKIDNQSEESGVLEMSKEENVSPKSIRQIEQEQPRKEFLLASSARENNIYIWRAGTDGRMQTFYTVPNKSSNKKHKSHPDKCWITINWIAPNVLLSSSRYAELLQWTVPKPIDSNNLMRLIHKDHSSILFNIAAPITYFTEYNWSNAIVSNVWTIGQERTLLNTHLGPDRKNLACYHTLAATINVIAASPLDPNRLALGLGDGTVKIWDLSRPHVKCVHIINFYEKIKAKILALAWHPVNENLLAYATIEGRIGVLDVRSNSKSPTLFPHYFKNQIYTIQWGPIKGNKNELGLYAVSEGKLAIFDLKHSSQDPLSVEMPDNTFVYQFSWSPNYKYFLLNTKSGNIIIYSTDLEIVKTVYLQKKLSNIFWHPDAFNPDVQSDYSNYFAATNNSKSFLLYKMETKDDDVNINLIHTFINGHVENVLSLSWNNFESTIISSVGEDGIANVWNIENRKIIANYLNNSCESIISVLHSPVNADIVITGCKDHLIELWKISDNLIENKSHDIFDLRKKRMQEITKETNIGVPKLEKPQEEPKPKSTKSKFVLLSEFYALKDNDKVIADMKYLLDWKLAKNSSDDAEVDKNHEILSVFGDNQLMVDLINHNQKIYKQKGKFHLANTLGLFKGDVNSIIVEAIQEKRVTPLIISLAPMASPTLWQEACEVYAQQLLDESESDPLEIATYFLACHKVDNAIKTLCDNSMYREALALAKARFQGKEIIDGIIENWAKYCVATGAFELAAQCYIYLGKFEDAASVLFRRSDLNILQFSIDLAEMTDNKALVEAIKMRYNAFKEVTNNNSTVTEEIEKLPTILDTVLNIQKENNADNVELENVEE